MDMQHGRFEQAGAPLSSSTSVPQGMYPSGDERSVPAYPGSSYPQTGMKHDGLPPTWSAAPTAVASLGTSHAPGKPMTSSGKRAALDAFDDGIDDGGDPITARMARLTRQAGLLGTHRLMTRRRRAYTFLAEAMLVLDVLLSLAALTVVTRYREVIAAAVPNLKLGEPAQLFGLDDTVMVGLLIIFLWPVIFSFCGLYRTSWTANLFSVVRALGCVALAGFLTSGLLSFLFVLRIASYLLCVVVVTFVFFLVSRIALRPLSVLRIFRRRVLVVGTGRLAIDAVRIILARRGQGLDLLGVVGPDREAMPELGVPPRWYDAMPGGRAISRLGELRDTLPLVHRHDVDLVVVALSPRERQMSSRVTSSLAHLPVQVYVLPDVATETARVTLDIGDGIPLVGLNESAIFGWQARAKRLMDIVVCVPLLLLLSPIMIAITLLVRRDSEGPALFKQERVGQHCRRFVMYKFRTMYVDADARVQNVAQQTAQGIVHKRRNDPRVTRIGALLRRTSLDELPQLINIVKGDMSLVGPRPELPWIVEEYRAWQYGRLLVPQGLTGWWQVNGRSDRVMHLHTQDDIFYVRNYSLWLDVKILLMTARVVVFGHGAF